MSTTEDGGTPKREMPEPLNTLLVKYGNGVQRYIRRRWRGYRPQDPDDLAQEVYLKLLRYPPSKIVRNPEGYLYRVATNVLRDFARRNAQEQAIFDSEPPSGYSDATVDASADHMRDTADAQELSAITKSLPPLHLAALLLCKRDGLSHAEAGKVIGKSADTVNKYIAEAIARCAVARTRLRTRGTVK